MMNSLRDMASSRSREQRAGTIQGLVFAEVVGVDDDGYELKYLSTTQSEPSSPARVATFMAGGGRGAYFMPEIGDEVVVGFELGNLDQPVILGSLWSDKDRPPDTADTRASNNRRTIVSRAGHQITLDDTPGQGKVVVKTNGGFEITLDDGAGTLTIKTTGNIATTRIKLDGVSWNHVHPSGSGATGTPQSFALP